MGRGIRFFWGTNRLDDERRERTDESMQQAERLAGAIFFVADEFEPFEIDGLGFGARSDRKAVHDS